MLLTLGGYVILLYIWILLPIYLYEPTRSFYLPHLLWFIHLFTLYIHEAGHFLFYILGGSLMQILVPFVWFLLAWREESRLMPAALFFTGEGMVDVSVYIKDAEVRLLPLLGGRHVRHDWVSLLGNAGMIDSAYLLGNIIFFLGLTVSFASLVWGVSSVIIRVRREVLVEEQSNSR
jgi:hypothetical protein